ncbi:MAG: hypothetical protein KDK27_12425, partial [Leptospiraceae bacterium]|nr:hypothetical protein [Leptospiraceae bacterium]
MAGESSILWNRSKDPRSRVWNNSGGASFEDLLAVLLSHGHRGRNVLEVSRELIQRVGDETGLFALEPGALTGIKGIGRARATTIIAAIELARRQVGNTLVGRGRGRLRLEDAPAWLYSELAAREQEYFYLLNFNRRRGLIDWHIMGTGGYDRVEVYYRDLLRTILNDRA